MSNDSRASSLRETVLPVVVLVAICMVAGLLLGMVHALTSPIAEANAEQKAQETYASLVPEATSFEPVACEVEGCTAALEAKDATGAVIAHVIVAQSKGYDVSARADLSAFPDAGSVSDWAQSALAWANASGLISGAVRGTQTILDPQGSASRAQVAMILMGYVEHVVNA